MKIQNINFKKVFIIFFAAFLIFTAVSTIFAISDGQWNDAVTFEQNRLEARNESGHTRWRGRAHHDRALLSPSQAETNDTLTETLTSTPAPGNRLLRSLARSYVRITATDFSVWNVFRALFHITFTALLALWVFVDSKKHGRNTILWTVITAVTSIFGWIAYLLFSKARSAPPAKA